MSMLRQGTFDPVWDTQRYDPHPVFGCDGKYQLRVATTIEERISGWQLLHRHYKRKGFIDKTSPLGLRYDLRDANPETSVIIISCEDKICATLTALFDSPLGLRADDAVPCTLDKFRAEGRKVCELSALACDAESDRVSNCGIVMQLFRFAYLLATRRSMATDIIVVVNPRHLAFYRKVLLFKSLRIVDKVKHVNGAPGILMHLDLNTAKERYLERYGKSDNSLYRFFESHHDDNNVQHYLRDYYCPLTTNDVFRYFVKAQNFLVAASTQQREFLFNSYAGLETMFHNEQESQKMFAFEM